MIEWLQEHAWILLWIMLTPIMLFVGIVHYILISFDNMKLNDWDDDRWDEDTPNDEIEDLFE